MRFDLRIELPQLALIAATFVLSAFAWPAAPDRVPMRWDFSGEVVGYGGKVEGLLLAPSIMLGAYGLLLFLPRIDPRRANYERFRWPYLIMRLATVAFIAVIHGVVLLSIWGVEINIAALIPLLVGIVLVVTGNLMGKIRPNWFFGVRTPWTLSSKRSWVKTHRLGGWVYVLIGFSWIGAAVAGRDWAFYLALAATIVGSLFLILYSYLVWRQDRGGEAPDGG